MAAKRWRASRRSYWNHFLTSMRISSERSVPAKSLAVGRLGSPDLKVKERSEEGDRVTKGKEQRPAAARNAGAFTIGRHRDTARP